jgi:hypothetical protein
MQDRSASCRFCFARKAEALLSSSKNAVRVWRATWRELRYLKRTRDPPVPIGCADRG